MISLEFSPYTNSGSQQGDPNKIDPTKQDERDNDPTRIKPLVKEPDKIDPTIPGKPGEPSKPSTQGRKNQQTIVKGFTI